MEECALSIVIDHLNGTNDSRYHLRGDAGRKIGRQKYECTNMHPAASVILDTERAHWMRDDGGTCLNEKQFDARLNDKSLHPPFQTTLQTALTKPPAIDTSVIQCAKDVQISCGNMRVDG